MIQTVSDFSKIDCCGCTACENTCPTAAIDMVPDVLGFKFPKVDSDNCIKCGCCLNVCPFYATISKQDNEYHSLAYGLRRSDETELIKSQSGGVAAVIAEESVHNGSIVYGVGFSAHYGVVHKRATSRDDIEEFKGSKYIQSDLGNILKSVKQDLCNNQQVVFFGTSCQVAGLKLFLPITLQNNLLCIDLVCHGVSSPKIWEEHLNSIENKYRKSISKVCFRNKEYGWHSRKETISFSDGTIVSPITFCLLNDLAIRESCSKCPFTNTERVGDISIGDFWGWEKHHSIWNDNKGVSLMLINTSKGERLFEKIKELFSYVKCEMSEILQPQLQHPMVLNKSYHQFISDYSKRGYNYITRRYADQGLRYWLLCVYMRLRLYKVKNIVFNRK